MLTVTAMFKVESITDQSTECKNIALRAVTADTPENKSWSKWTPAGLITMSITNPAAYEQFVVGKQYRLTFEQVD